MMNKPTSVITTELLKPPRTSCAGTSPLKATINRTMTAISSILRRVRAIMPKSAQMMPMTTSSADVNMADSRRVACDCGRSIAHEELRLERIPLEDQADSINNVIDNAAYLP